jgi:hypothetical protein
VDRDTLVGRDAGTAPYYAAVVGALPLLLTMACAAPHGGSWRWLGLRVDTIVLSSLIGVLCIRLKTPTLAVAAPALILLWRLGKESLALSDLNALEHMSDSAEIIFSGTWGALETWLTAAIFTSLVWLAARRRVGLADANDRNFVALGGWFIGVGAVGVWQALANPDWYTLENLKGDGTYVSGTAWPDTKVITLVLAAATVVNAASFILRAQKRRRERRAFVATLPAAAWRSAKSDAQVPPLLDPPSERGLVLFEVEAAAGSYREGGLERPVARL